jgi:hypothetical protein
MQTVTRNVDEIDVHDRRALEHLLGQSLHENQRLVINIVNLEPSPEVQAEAASNGTGGVLPLPEWCNVYEGLSDAEIADLEQTILQRADLSRRFE